MIIKKFFLAFLFFAFSTELQGYSIDKTEETPEFVKGLYINAYRAGDKKYMENLLNDFGSLINTLVIDIKDSHGTLTYKSKLKIARTVGSQGTLISNIDKYINDLKNRGYYIIGRIVVFRDPLFARYKNNKFGIKIKGTKGLWKDENGFVWVDPFSEEVWKYNISIAEEAAQRGFDEIQFDYVRFPSYDGTKIPYFPFQKKRNKEEAIISFLIKARKKLQRQGIKVSVVLFGYTAWQNHLPREGQLFVEMGKKVDAVYPILYPSHFADNFLAEKQKQKRTYNIIFKSIKRGNALLQHSGSKLIAYIQGFDWKRSKLGKDYIGIQMQACEDANSKGWIVWNAKGEYKETYNSLLNYSIRLVKPSSKIVTEKNLISRTKNENKFEESDTRGIEAILHW